jgi:hypothetical protein
LRRRLDSLARAVDSPAALLGEPPAAVGARGLLGGPSPGPPPSRRCVICSGLSPVQAGGNAPEPDGAVGAARCVATERAATNMLAALPSTLPGRESEAARRSAGRQRRRRGGGKARCDRAAAAAACWGEVEARHHRIQPGRRRRAIRTRHHVRRLFGRRLQRGTPRLVMRAPWSRCSHRVGIPRGMIGYSDLRRPVSHACMDDAACHTGRVARRACCMEAGARCTQAGRAASVILETIRRSVPRRTGRIAAPSGRDVRGEGRAEGGLSPGADVGGGAAGAGPVPRERTSPFPCVPVHTWQGRGHSWRRYGQRCEQSLGADVAVVSPVPRRCDQLWAQS